MLSGTQLIVNHSRWPVQPPTRIALVEGVRVLRSSGEGQDAGSYRRHRAVEAVLRSREVSGGFDARPSGDNTKQPVTTTLQRDNHLLLLDGFAFLGPPLAGFTATA